MLDCQLSSHTECFQAPTFNHAFSSCPVHCVKLVLMVSQDVSTALRDTREIFVEGEELCQAVEMSLFLKP